MKTLVIHPEDTSTDFLADIYWDKGWTLMDDPFIERKELIRMIQNHDRIVMLGHGSPLGLFGGFDMMIDDSLAPLLRQKKTVCVWCNADKFVEHNELTGFYTGMFISEVAEANCHNINNVDEIDVEDSNFIFATLMNDYIFHENVLQEMKYHYQLDNNPVSAYNNERLYMIYE